VADWGYPSIEERLMRISINQIEEQSFSLDEGILAGLNE
jgi:hypothetical protein